MENWFLNFDPRRKVATVIVAFLCIPTIGALDYLTGPDITFSLFYLAPVAITAWFSSRPLSLASSALSALAWLLVDFSSGRYQPLALVYGWNFASRLLSLWVVSLLIFALRQALERQHQLSRVDGLTGALNVRSFLEIAESELERSSRHGHPITLAYIDVDHFKRVNDTLGHSAGDELLRVVAEAIRGTLRGNDTLARLGGDEFAILLPESDAGAARVFVNRVHKHLSEVVRRRGWSITFSVGVLTCTQPPQSADTILEMADRLMYTVKNSTRDAITFAVYPETDARFEREPTRG